MVTVTPAAVADPESSLVIDAPIIRVRVATWSVRRSPALRRGDLGTPLEVHSGWRNDDEQASRRRTAGSRQPAGPGGPADRDDRVGPCREFVRPVAPAAPLPRARRGRHRA